MKKIIKINLKIMIAFVIGGIVFGSVGVVSAYTLLSNHIEYQPADSAWKVNNVEDALDSLYIAKTGDNYSTEERVVGTWIDGQPLYQKTFTGTLTTGNGDTRVYTGVNTDFNIDIIPHISGSVYKLYNGNVYALTSANGTNYHAEALIEDDNLIIRDKGFSTEYNYIVTIQYTKTEPTQTNEG